MRQLETRHILLFRVLRDHCSFLTRRQIQRVLTLTTSGTTKSLHWLMAEHYLERRYRVDSFQHFQTPVYYLGETGWRVAGQPASLYKRHRLQVEQRPERQIEHMLATYDVFLKFILEADVRRLIGSEDRLWKEAIDFGNVPDGWVQFDGGAAFIEVDRATERPIVLRKKFERYINFNTSGRYGQLFPDGGFKVLVITTTEERIESLERVARSDDIWFCSMRDFLSHPLDHEYWFALHGFHALPVSPKKEMQELQEALP
jgi:Replication-relaxation